MRNDLDDPASKSSKLAHFRPDKGNAKSKSRLAVTTLNLGGPDETVGGGECPADNPARSKERVSREDFLGGELSRASEARFPLNHHSLTETLEMKRTLETRKLVERAKGILQYKHNLTEEEAYLRLRNESRRLRRPMRDLAEAVIMADDLNKSQSVSESRSSLVQDD